MGEVDTYSSPGAESSRIGLTHSLEVEGHHLAASIPEDLGHVVGRVHSCPLGVNPAQLHLVVPEQVRGLRSTTPDKNHLAGEKVAAGFNQTQGILYRMAMGSLWDFCKQHSSR